MMSTLKKLFVSLLLIMAVAAISGCKEGPMEQAGKKIDEAAEDAGEAIKDAKEKVEDKIEK
jgi:predicted small lipoprotein YifL